MPIAANKTGRSTLTVSMRGTSGGMMLMHNDKDGHNLHMLGSLSRSLYWLGKKHDAKLLQEAKDAKVLGHSRLRHFPEVFK